MNEINTFVEIIDKLGFSFWQVFILLLVIIFKKEISKNIERIKEIKGSNFNIYLTNLISRKVQPNIIENKFVGKLIENIKYINTKEPDLFKKKELIINARIFNKIYSSLEYLKDLELLKYSFSKPEIVDNKEVYTVEIINKSKFLMILLRELEL